MTGPHTLAADLARSVVGRREYRPQLVRDAQVLLDRLEGLDRDEAARVLVNALDFAGAVGRQPDLVPLVHSTRRLRGPREMLRSVD